MTKRRAIICVWLLVLAIAGLLIARAPFRADMSMFLPDKPSAQQQLLLNNLAAGSTGRMLLIGVEGVDKAALRDFSSRFSAALATNPAVARVNNGDPAGFRADQEFVFRYRYLLSNRLSAESFSSEGLRASIAQSVQDLASSTGMLTKSLLTSDPTGETMALVNQISGAGNMTLTDSVWTSPDAKRLLFVCYTQANGADLDGQELALSAIRSSFEATRSSTQQTQAKLFLTGPGVFATESRDAIRGDVSRLSTIGSVLIVLTLLLALRSIRLVSVGIVPMISSVIVATASLALIVGSVHAMVLGFGTTLIGEAVDYALYYLVRADKENEFSENAPTAKDAQQGFWKAIRLGMTISVIGFGALLLSGFPGLKQLAIFSIAGLLTAVLVTRYVLPIVAGTKHRGADFAWLDAKLDAFAAAAKPVRWLSIVVLLVALAVAWQHRGTLWSNNLSSLNPVSAGAQQLDQELRNATGSPDVRLLVAVQGADQEAVLSSIERFTPALEALVSDGVIAGYESPAQWLPSKAKQSERRALLPSAPLATERLAAIPDLPLRVERMQEFVQALETSKNSRTLPDISQEVLSKTQLGLLAESLLYASPVTPGQTLDATRQFNGLVSLRLPSGQAASAPLIKTIHAKLVAAGQTSSNNKDQNTGTVYVLDLLTEANAMYASYLGESFRVAGFGGLGIALLLLFTTRSLKDTVKILWPLGIALAIVIAFFALRGIQLNLLHLIGLFLMVAVGSNYSLFSWLGMKHGKELAPSTPSAQLLACLTTVIGFGVLAFSQVPLLSALGSTVGLGAGLSLLFSWVWIGTRRT